MCGLAGMLRPGGAEAMLLQQAASAMTQAIAYRGPDGVGLWCDGAAGIALGHRRLAIIDLSQQGAQPMASASGRYHVVYNGEIYNYRDLRRRLEAERPRQWRGGSDTEVLLAAIEDWGLEAALQAANGMFAIALWDMRERRLVLARDRFGQKPMLYGWNGRDFLFGSELGALAACPGFAAPLEPAAVDLLLRYGHVPAPWSIRAGIRKLPPGCLLELDANSIAPGQLPEPRRWWSAVAVAEAGLATPYRGSQQDATEELDALLRDAVRLCMVADVPLGAFLSGGIDSSVVVAQMQAVAREQGGPPARSFSIGFNEDRFDEAQHARAVAAHLGTDHTELYVGEAEALAVVPQLGKLFDEPFADASQIPTYLVSKLARGAVTVSLSGDGGDELFGGYSRYALARRLGALAESLPQPLLGLGLNAIEALPPGWLNRLRPMLGDRLHKLAMVLRSGNTRGIYRRLMQQSMADNAGSSDLRDRPQDWPALDDPRQMMLLLDAQTYLPDDILVKLDRASMAVGLESRVPLLDHRLYEFAWRLPAAWKFGEAGALPAGGKSILRRVLHRHVPPALVERPKMGFGVPLDRWLAGPLRDWAEALLNPAALAQSGLLDVAAIRRQWQQQLSRERRWPHALWCVLMFQAWQANQSAAALRP